MINSTTNIMQLILEVHNNIMFLILILAENLQAYTTSPTGFTAGDFNGKTAIQPLSHNGKYFVYFSGQTCYIIFLDHAFEPARGFTQVHSFTVQHDLPNGSTRNPSFNRMYVASGRIFFAKYYETTITTVYDITIDGTAPDDLT